MTDADLDLVEELVDAHHAEAASPGLAYGVVLGGRLLHSGSRGECQVDGSAPGADTVFRIASMTKSFTAATVLLLRDEGLLRLDDPVADHVPQAVRLVVPTVDAPVPTIRSLLTMTAGLPTDDPWGDRQQDLPDDDFLAMLAGGLSFARTPGTAFEYSNLGYALLGRVITAAAAEPYRDVVRRRLLAPLEMTSTGFVADGHSGDHTEDHVAGRGGGERLARGYRWLDGPWEEVPIAGYGAFAPMGGLFSTVTDLARWVGWLCGAFPPRDETDAGPLSRASRRELQLAHLALPPAVTWTSLAEPPVIRSAAYGFGLIVEQDNRLGTVVSHSGGYPGFGSHMRWHPDSGLGVVVLANATYAPSARLGSRLVDALLVSDAIRSRHRPGALPAPAPGSMAAATAQARNDVSRLIATWDDDLAARLLAMNVDLDDPLPRRRRQLTEAARLLGPLDVDDEPVTSRSPAHCVWWLRGPGGRMRCEIRMTPERPPRVQTLIVTAVPTPSDAVSVVAQRIAAQLGQADPTWPDGVPLAAGLDRGEVVGQLRVAAAWAGACTVGPALAGDGEREATFRLDGGRRLLQLSLALARDAVSACTFALLDVTGDR